MPSKKVDLIRRTSLILFPNELCSEPLCQRKQRLFRTINSGPHKQMSLPVEQTAKLIRPGSNGGHRVKQGGQADEGLRQTGGATVADLRDQPKDQA